MTFSKLILNHVNDEQNFLNAFMFIDRAIFPISGHVNLHNCQMWDWGYPHVVWEHICHNPRVNVCIFGPFSFVESTNNGQSLPGHAKELCFSSEETGLTNSIIFQQDGTPLHFSKCDVEVSSAALPGRWIGRIGSNFWHCLFFSFVAVSVITFVWTQFETWNVWKQEQEKPLLWLNICRAVNGAQIRY